MAKISGIENALRFEKIAYNASWRNFIFVNFARKSFSTSLSTPALSRYLWLWISWFCAHYSLQRRCTVPLRKGTHLMQWSVSNQMARPLGFMLRWR